MASAITTYTRGPAYYVTRSVTDKDLVEVCRLLGDAFCQRYGRRYAFRPEAISEGGIEWLEWPGKQDDQYKSMRLRFHQYPQVDKINGPTELLLHCIPPETDHTIEAISKARLRRHCVAQRRMERMQRSKLASFLKAFGNAPAWTIEELDLFASCFGHVGILVKRVPKASSLCYTRNHFQRDKPIKQKAIRRSRTIMV